MDPRALLGALAGSRVDARLSSFGSGWEHQVWAVDHDLVLRVNPAADRRTRIESVQRDVRVLDLVGRHVSTSVGEVVAAAPADGALLQRRVPGRSLADGAAPAEGLAGDLAELLTDLRAVPAALAVDVAGPPPVSPEQWLDDLRVTYPTLAQWFPADLRSKIERWIEQPAGCEAATTLCHNDLGDEHVMVDERGRLTGVIDWSDSVAGDPARDLALVQFDLGARAASDVLAAGAWTGDAALWERARWFAVRAGLWGICHRLSHGLGGVEEQLRRLRIWLPA